MSAAAPAASPDTTTTTTPWHARLRFGTGDRAAAALLLVFTIIAIVWANSPWGDTYERFWETPVELGVGDLVLTTTLHHVVNDAVMTLFFFVVGLEVKREFTLGELTDPKRAVVPVVAAIAGLIVPALIFLLIAWPSGEAQAWGVVISMDTAFLLGALAIIGPKFPARLRAFLLTLAVVDDIGALLAIAVFYNSGIQLLPLAVAVVLMVAIALVRFMRA
ncbi:MAG TPA: Na+/H+ antiporter NhaA, partial [Agromyces sp.]|nr:Na+/H+ antiporter NhaA [Agromyces sp.]